MKGGGWEGGGESDAINRGLLEFLQNNGKNGVVIDGVVAWIDVQTDGVAEAIWMSQAEAKYSDEEVNDAKKAPWDAEGKNIGDSFQKRIGTVYHEYQIWARIRIYSQDTFGKNTNTEYI